MSEIRIAKPHEYEQVLSFYYQTIDLMENAEYSSLWKKDIYPSNNYIKESIEKGELWIYDDDGAVISSMIINHEANDGYKNIEWSIQAEKDEVYVIHAFGVLPTCQGRGIASRMLDNLKDFAAKNGAKAIRIDVIENNLPANKLYIKNKFSYVCTSNMYYDDTGWIDLNIFEYIL